ncbi:MAG: polyhydroxybutyrate depolymerase [Actinomycetota bacterium]|nr:polyhydroxybutyrate depolymerase [Actinomycetota bacterium]
MTRQIEAAGAIRTYLLAVPSSHPSPQPAPLILNFHGFGSNALEQAAYSRLNDLGPERGFVVVTPEGSGSPARWTLPRAIPGIDEVAFVRALLDQLHEQLCIDDRRVYATGMSNGAAFSAHLACRLESGIAAIAPVAGINLVEPCQSPAPLSVIAFHGTADAVVPFHGGRIAGTFLVRSVPDAVAEWAAHGHCPTAADDVRIAPDVRLRVYDACPRGNTVRLYTIEGGGHTWPGAPLVPTLGPVTHEIDASRLLLDFFAAHPRADGPPAPLAPTAADFERD